MSMMTTVRVGWRQLGGIHIIGAPTFFLNSSPASSKSGPGTFTTILCKYVLMGNIEDNKRGCIY